MPTPMVPASQSRKLSHSRHFVVCRSPESGEVFAAEELLGGVIHADNDAERHVVGRPHVDMLRPLALR
jgi:hypothetical protein